MTRRGLRVLLWVAVGLALLVLVLQAFVAGVHHVDSGSMAPALEGPGEHVLVRYGTPRDLRRFDVVVVERAGERPAVKRVVGLPGESIQVRGGDLIVDGARLSPDHPRPEPVPVFDSRWHDVEEFFSPASETSWSRRDGSWLLDVPPGPSSALGGGVFADRPLNDGHVDARHRRLDGSNPVDDAILEVEVLLERFGGRLYLFFQEDGGEQRSFRATLEPGAEPGGPVHVALLGRSGLEGAEQVLAEITVPFATGAWHLLRLSHVDEHLALSLDDAGTILEADTGGEDGGSAGGGVRGAFGGEDLAAEFRSIRVLRDLHYTDRGTHGTAAPIQLGPGELFLLGDNSAESLDGREWGPVRTSEVVGRPVAVVWPPARVRSLPRPPADGSEGP